MLLCLALLGGEIVRLGPDTWDRVPRGKEVDAIYGDWLLRNDKVVAVVAGAEPNRHVHLSIKHAQGALIDFALLSSSNDQLSAFLPHRDGSANVPQAHRVEVVKGSGPELVLRATREATERDPVEATTDYVLREGEAFLRVTTRYRNTTAREATARLSDKMRCDQTFAQTPAGEGELVVFHDRWFGAAYGVLRLDGRIRTDGKFGGMFGVNSGTWLDYPELGRSASLAPGEERSVTRLLLVADDGAGVERAAHALLGSTPRARKVKVVGDGGQAVAGAELRLSDGLREVAWARSREDGMAEFFRGGRLQVAAPGYATASASLEDEELRVDLGARSAVEFDVDGPCKVQFLGVDGTPTPEFGPKQRAACANLWHAAGGTFRVPVPPGKYYLILSRGPEHDAVFRYVIARPGASAKVVARIPRVVDTRGWISADFHNHATESGDNTTETESRLLCLAAEGVEFAPATEHNRIVSWKDEIRALGLGAWMSTSDGIELTGNPLPLNHHNAFPLVPKPRTQDGGGPATAVDPLTQLRRLADHDAGAEKLLQQNHPDVGWLFYDADGDGRKDLGFGTAKFTDAIEMWRPGILAMRPTESFGLDERNNRAFNWLQLLNQGIRIPGVANTDAHYCVHESGRLRNWIRSSTDDPEKIDELEIVRQTKKGRGVMSNGPFLEATLDGLGPGDTLGARRAILKVRVQCPNWLDVDRVQVLVNGRPSPAHDFRRGRAEGFRDGVVKFEAEVPMEFAADAHVIVVAVGESSTCGPVMGQNTEAPMAVANPIWVDVDGGGVKPNGDTLGAPLPTKRGREKDD